MKPRSLARARRRCARALAVAPAAAMVSLDLTLRSSLLRQYTPRALVWYAGCGVLGAVAWGALIVASARRRSTSRWVARGLLAALALLATGTQLQTWRRYGSYLSWQTALWGTSIWPYVGHRLWADRACALAILVAPVAAALAIVAAARRLAPPRRRAAQTALPVAAVFLGLSVAFGGPRAGWDLGTTPDVLWLNASGALVRSMLTHEDIMVELAWLPGARAPDALPALHAHPARSRNVLLLVDESVRADDDCSTPRATCETTPFTNALLPNRLGFTQVRALDSTTTLSMLTLLSGLPPSEPRARLLSAPLLPEYAYAAGIDTAFWTSQNLLFANSGRFYEGLPFHASINGTQLEPYATYETGADDAKALDRALEDLRALRPPYFAIVQLANTHFPYVVDGGDLPFSTHIDWRKMDRFGQAHVRQRDAIHRQDKILARFLEALRERPEGRRTVVVFVSDHGEQLGERGQLGHTWSVYDEEIRVPMWINAPDGTLSGDEAAHLRALGAARLTTLEVAPTLLDLLGLWDDPALAAWRARMQGVSLLRGGPPADRGVVLTNCSQIYWCATRNWGAMRGANKLIATEDEAGSWRCFDVATDPGERHDLGPAACADLQTLAEAEGRGKP